MANCIINLVPVKDKTGFLQMPAPVPAAKLVDNYPDTTKSANPKIAAEKKQAKRTESLPPGFFLSIYQERRRPHPATLPARIIKNQFDPKAAALKLLKETTQQTLPPPKEVKEGKAEEDELEVVTEAPPRVLNKAQEDAIAIFRATKAAYLNAKNYDEMDFLKSYLEQVISSFWVVQKFLPWRRMEPLHGTKAHQGSREQQATDKGKQRARSKEAVQDPKNRPNQTGSVGIEAKTLRAKAEEEREQVERGFPHGPSAHEGQGCD
ncbi:hypothetical protein PTTG_10396 [Puccinia triticina 1-1 BBBD Race 1]|uniref:Uncharacterized protein n=1 Tax=Puccinia triticina (isolate 1-1 / race 1 (BBBD)) TaxID=630390 RepID=A0A180G5S7_PUCT1|nr:hypothetical protein PTTG_10396 [Puccinia triticina 1-1 BBBD Race 1]